MLRDVILKHFLRLVYMRKFLIYILWLVFPVISLSQTNKNQTHKILPFDNKNPQVGQFLLFYDFWVLEGANEALHPASDELADSFISLMKQHPNFIWEIGCFTDCRGNDSSNLKVTANHAKKVRDYFINKKFDSTLLTYKGYGETEPFIDCKCNYKRGKLRTSCSDGEHLQNRRTEIKIIAIKEDSIHIDTSTVKFKKPKVGQYVRFKILHDLDRPDVARVSWPTLDSVSRIIKLFDNVTWEIGVHTDCRSSLEYSTNLGKIRAIYISYYLFEKGIDSSFLTTYGYGESQLLNHCWCEPNNVGPGKDCTEEEHQINRRTELKIIAIKD